MALNKAGQETLDSEGENSKLHLFCDNVTTEQNKEHDVQLCRICFASNCNLYSLKQDTNLGQAYETLTGLLIQYEDNMPPYLCTECSDQLLHCIHFRTRSLRAHLLLLEILRKHDCITLEAVKSLNDCQDVSTSNLELIQSSVDQYNLKTINKIKKENEYTEEQIYLKNELSSQANIDLNDIKKEDEDDVRSIDEDTLYSSIVHKNTLSGDIKTEKNVVYNVEDINDGDTVSDEMAYVDAFEGDDGEDYNIFANDQNHKAKLSSAEVKGISKMKTQNSLKVKSSVSNVKLLQHLKTHASTKPYKCNYTTNVSQKKNFCKKKFSCDSCKKTLSSKCGLHKHMKTHTGEKPYTCDVCERSFKENRDLQNHLRTHSGEKPFGCDLCNKSFSERGNLLRHIRIHSGEKPFSCRFCKISFSQKHHLKRHLTKHYKVIQV